MGRASSQEDFESEGSRRIGAMKKDQKDKTRVSVRFGPEVMARIDALLPLLSVRIPKSTRAEAVRELIVRGLDRIEREHPMLRGDDRPKGSPPDQKKH